MSKFLATIGILITASYLAFLYIAFGLSISSLRSLQPNELGDFFAGIFGPIAILWLILGYFQQGIELRLNTRALELQAEELKNSVAHQKDLVEVTKTQVANELESIRHERAAQAEAARPKFVFSGVGGSFGAINRYRTSITNVGATATEVALTVDPAFADMSLNKVAVWSTGEEKEFKWTYKNGVADYDSILYVNYVDAAGQPGAQQFSFTRDLNNQYKLLQINRA
jgi:hypothetical protein